MEKVVIPENMNVRNATVRNVSLIEFPNTNYSSCVDLTRPDSRQFFKYATS